MTSNTLPSRSEGKGTRCKTCGHEDWIHENTLECCYGHNISDECGCKKFTPEDEIEGYHPNDTGDFMKVETRVKEKKGCGKPCVENDSSSVACGLRSINHGTLFLCPSCSKSEDVRIPNGERSAPSDTSNQSPIGQGEGIAPTGLGDKTLSSKIDKDNNIHWWYVKTFIKKLKEDYSDNHCNCKECYVNRINKRAGDKLNGQV